MPSSVVFIGGGTVAVELAQALARLSVKTWIIYRSALLRYEEETASRFVEELWREEGVGLVRGEATAVEVKDGGVVAAEVVFVAAGRIPNVEPLGGLLRLGPTAGLR